ncbi:DUF1292 domain-containing protein [uncultured Clostridium sp.]|uniref:DUF1292 domain-containing protein n=1 Tax=uncultured Clostridium sp. TaxID=59620 RepID=UPI00263490F5|nr:DUF1292 domain-containing protein [uncultured Clostridium sp.]
MQEDINRIVLSDENGVEVTFLVETYLEIEGTEFVLLTPEEDENGDVIAMRIVKDEDGSEGLEPVDNEVELAMIEEAYSAIMNEE